MRDLTCWRCGGHIFFGVEFRNTDEVKIIMGREEVGLICPHCRLVVYNLVGRVEPCYERRPSLGHRIKTWLKHFRGNLEEETHYEEESIDYHMHGWTYLKDELDVF